jgi:hypothetical protein
MGSIALLLLVRKQIKSNYSNFVGAQTHPEFQLPTLTPTQPGEGDDIISPAESSASKDLSVSVQQTGRPAFSLTPATPLMPAQAYSAGGTGRDSMVLFESPGSSRRGSLTSPFGTTSASMSRSSSIGNGNGQEKRKKKTPSRAAVRSMAKNELGGVAAAQALNLSQLHRVEMDLFIVRFLLALLPPVPFLLADFADLFSSADLLFFRLHFSRLHRPFQLGLRYPSGLATALLGGNRSGTSVRSPFSSSSSSINSLTPPPLT